MPTAIKKIKIELTSDEIFENAYTLYRKNENGRALAAISQGDQNELRFIELKAQLLYRLERCDEALELFNKQDDEFDETRRANVCAVYALIGAKKAKNNETSFNIELPFKQDTFEQLYNTACLFVYQSNYNEAIKLLDKASVKCRETLTEDGLTEEEILEELSVILTQKAFALQKLGLVEEALNIYKLIQESNISDPNVRAVVFNNLQCIEPPFSDRSKLIEARKQLSKITQKKKTKLSQAQKEIDIFKSNTSLAAAAAVAGKEVFQEIVTGKLNKKKHKRKPRLPKNYDPNVPPDPERWLPKYERVAYKKKLNRKFKDRDIGRGTQGVSSAQSSNFYIEHTKPGPPSPKVEQSPNPGSKGPRQQKPATATKKNTKKRKGGNKW